MFWNNQLTHNILSPNVSAYSYILALKGMQAIRKQISTNYDKVSPLHITTTIQTRKLQNREVK